MILLHLTIAKLKILARNRQAIFWALFFPLLFIIVFGIFFRDGPVASLAVADNANDEMSARIITALESQPALAISRGMDEADARQQARDGDLSFALILPEGLHATATTNPPAQVTILYDETHQAAGMVTGMVQSVVGAENLRVSGLPPNIAMSAEPVSGANFSRIDAIMPALAIWGVMIFSVIGLASSLTIYRERKILIKIQATPMKVSVFFAAEVIAHLVLALIQVAILLTVAVLVFGASMNGSLLHIAIIVIIANLVYLNIGFIVAGYAKTAAAVSGLGNAIVMPLALLSGVFFPLDALPNVVRYIAEYLPLAPALAVMRGIAIEARPIWDYPIELATICCWIIVTALVAMKTFKFR